MNLSFYVKFTFLTPIHDFGKNVLKKPRIYNLIFLVFLSEPMKITIYILVNWIEHIIDYNAVAWFLFFLYLNQIETKSSRFTSLRIQISAISLSLIPRVLVFEPSSYKPASFVDSMS